MVDTLLIQTLEFTTVTTWLKYFLVASYIIGFVFMLYVRSVIDETPIRNRSNTVKNGVLFLIWALSPAVLVGLISVTLKTLFSNGK